MQKTEDPDFKDKGMIRSVWEAYQQKVHYEVKSDSSEVEEDGDDALALEDKLFA